MEKVILAIKNKWPRGSRKGEIKIQWDNAKPHASIIKQAIVQAGNADCWNISLTCQLTNSPNCNVLDHTFFNSIQSLQHRQAPMTIDKLIQAIYKASDALEVEKLDVFLT